MEERSVTHSTFVIERNFGAAPQAVFAAFSNPAKKRRWFGGSKTSVIEEFEMDFRVGGSERVRYRFTGESPMQGKSLTNDTSYRDIVPDRRLVIAYNMSVDETRISASLATFELTPEGTGTKLIFTDQGAFFQGSDGPDMRKAGWISLLERLDAELAGQ